jgi:hypothetical protein
MAKAVRGWAPPEFRPTGPRRNRTQSKALVGSLAAFGKPAASGRSKAGLCASGWRAPGQRGNQVHLVGIVQNLLRVRLTAVDDEQD